MFPFGTGFRLHGWARCTGGGAWRHRNWYNRSKCSESANPLLHIWFFLRRANIGNAVQASKSNASLRNRLSLAWLSSLYWWWQTFPMRDGLDFLCPCCTGPLFFSDSKKCFITICYKLFLFKSCYKIVVFTCWTLQAFAWKICGFCCLFWRSIWKKWHW